MAAAGRFCLATRIRAFSVSKSNIPEVVDYIRNQEEHHQRMTLQQEYLALLRAHGIEYDERYIWD